MLSVRFATRRSEARYPTLWDGLVAAYCPSVQNASGTTLFDLSGYNNNGTLTNMDPANDWVHSGAGRALDFDGVNDHIVASPSISGTSATLSCWIRLNVATPATVATTGFIQTRTGATGIASHYPFTDGLGYFHTFRTARVNSVTLSSAVTRTNWHHVAIVTDGATWRLYQNGIQVHSTAAESSVTFSSASFRIGYTFGSAGQDYYTAGQYDDVRLYERALTDGAIAILASQRGIAYVPKRVGRYGTVAAATFNASWARRQQLIGSGVY